MISAVGSVSSLVASDGTPKPLVNAPASAKPRGNDTVEISANARAAAASAGGDTDGDGDSH